jgi:hypothetical protein
MPDVEMTIDAASRQIQSVQIQGVRGPHHSTIPQHLGDLLGQPTEETNTPECAGCYVPETHDPRGGVALPVTQVRDLLLAADGAPRDGISVVGGEPFAQPEAVHALLQLCRPWVPHITVYSGYTLAALLRRMERAVREILG